MDFRSSCLNNPTSAGIFLYLLQAGMIPFIKPYQANRILTWLDPSKDPNGYYQQENSIMAISSGQLWGKGLNTTEIASVKHGNYLVEERTTSSLPLLVKNLDLLEC